MNRAVLGIGSNVADAPACIAEALERLVAAGITVCRRSSMYAYSDPYINKVVEVLTELSADELSQLAKAIERAMGRTPRMKALGLVPIDIDVVIFNDMVVRPRDYDAPYFKQGYEQMQDLKS